MEYRFTIADSFTPETLPMERLAEYVAAFAKLLGEQGNVHFRSIEAGSAVLVAAIDAPAEPKVRERMVAVHDGGGPSDARKAFADLDEMLRKDNATGALSDAAGALVISFPGRNRPEPLIYGPFRQDGTIDGQLIRSRRQGRDRPGSPSRWRDHPYGPRLHTRNCAQDRASSLRTDTARPWRRHVVPNWSRRMGTAQFQDHRFRSAG